MEIFVAEVVGTMILILLGCGVVAGVALKGSKADGGGWIVVTMGWGLAVAMGVYAAGWVSGAHLNPAVTFAMLLDGTIDAGTAVIYVAGECVGAFIGAVLVWVAYKDHFDATDDADTKLGVFCTAPAIRNLKSNFITEVVGTAMLILGIYAITQANNGLGGGFGPYAIGMLIVAIGLSLGGPTGYAINPARDLMPRLAHAMLPIKGKRDGDWGYALIPVVAPLVGSAIAVVIWHGIVKPVYAQIG